jgi:hypothetical protein
MTNTDTPAFDARMLITAANACYAQARDKALPPLVRAKLARAADALVAAVDAHHEATAPPPPKIGGYDKDRCRSCGRIWLHHTTNCSNDRHRPIERPEWLDKAVAASEADAGPTDPRERAAKLIEALNMTAIPGRELNGTLKAAIIAQANDLANGEQPGSGR